MRYELAWLTTFNIAGEFSTIDGALAVVRDTAEDRGDTYVDDLMLAQLCSDGEYQEVATGPELLALARAGCPTAQPSSLTAA